MHTRVAEEEEEEDEGTKGLPALDGLETKELPLVNMHERVDSARV